MEVNHDKYIREGVKESQQGDKASSKGIFRKPDWDIAASHYDCAATQFKLAKSYEQAVKAYQKSSNAYEKADAIHLAGVALEKAAVILVNELKQPQNAAQVYSIASGLFYNQGSTERAAEQLIKAGNALKDIDVNASYEMYNKAIILYEQDDKGRFAMDTFKKAISLTVINKKYDKTIELLKRQSPILKKLTSRSHFYKNNLSILIVILASGDEVEAIKQFANMCGDDPNFARSEDAEIAEDILKAYEYKDQQLLEKTIRVQHVTFLDTEILRLARTLTVPGEVLSSGAWNPQSQYHNRNYGNNEYSNPQSKYGAEEEEEEDDDLR